MVDTAGRPPLVAGLASEVKDRVLSGKESHPWVPPGGWGEGGTARLDDHNFAFNSSCELYKHVVIYGQIVSMDTQVPGQRWLLASLRTAA